MNSTKLYDQVKFLLECYPETRNSDKQLVWKFYEFNGFVSSDGAIYKQDFLAMNSPDSVSRAARMIKHLHPELKGEKKIVELKEKKQLEKGTHIFREQLSF